MGRGFGGPLARNVGERLGVAPGHVGIDLAPASRRAPAVDYLARASRGWCRLQPTPAMMSAAPASSAMYIGFYM
jgi:hypothetical protein